ncbi:hypothetical protein Q7C36_003708 [Tachysurus vachellii]|uniref:Uncharacterized protein n=1 Tax=Tachysurus vachellii TaxID=175792 RepID=A0AA88T7N5_TACVA|nr:hypothetical protein Q7C36_003708 [Tachysurus vachellii]
MESFGLVQRLISASGFIWEQIGRRTTGLFRVGWRKLKLELPQQIEQSITSHEQDFSFTVKQDVHHLLVKSHFNSGEDEEESSRCCLAARKGNEHDSVVQI